MSIEKCMVPMSARMGGLQDFFRNCLSLNSFQICFSKKILSLMFGVVFHLAFSSCLDLLSQEYLT
jgi:hypothetical protein